MYRKIEDFEKAWQYETESMNKVLAGLTDESLSQSVADDHRTLGRIAWHITTTIPEMMNRTGLKVTALKAEDAVPKSAKEIAGGFKAVADELLAQIKDNWNDDSLEQTDDMYGEQWQRGMTLGALVGHQAHHRGQMTVLMRQAGLTVPGVYGPSKEEWSNYGMQAPEI